jgi:hypothetical protein
MVSPSIQRIEREGGKAEIIATELDGKRFNGPNDLVFGPDGRLYFTDPGTYRPADPQPSYLFVLDVDGSGRLLAELDPPTFPNGIAIEADGSVVWAESYTGMVRRLRPDSGAIGIAAARRQAHRRRLAVGATVAHVTGSMAVASTSGPMAYDRFIRPGHPHQLRLRGRDLIMTDAGVLAERRRQLRRTAVAPAIHTDGLPTWKGASASEIASAHLGRRRTTWSSCCASSHGHADGDPAKGPPHQAEAGVPAGGRRGRHQRLWRIPGRWANWGLGA